MNEELSLLTDRARSFWRGCRRGRSVRTRSGRGRASTSEQSALEALDELLQCDLVRPTDVPRRFRFRHPLVRRAVYESTAGGWRLGAHERCAQLLAARGASTSRAHHIERSAAQGDPAAVATLGRPATQPHTAHRRARRAGTRPHFACSPRARRAKSASNSSSPAPKRWERPAAIRTAIARCRRAWRSCRTSRSISEHGSPQAAPGSSACSASTTPRMTASPVPSTAFGTGAPRRPWPS